EPDTQQENLPDRTRTRSPAYVAPIPKIGSIPKVSPGIALSPERPKLPPFVGSFLMGKKVDEYGDIVDDQTGQVLARAGGDLPEIVGRKVSNRDGDILGDNGELLGYVADVEIERKGSTSPQSPRAEAQPRSLLDMMRKANASLMVDHLGNILDPAGNIVGKFHDNNNPLHRKEREEQELRERIQQQAAAGPSSVRKKKQEKKPEKEDKEGQEDGAAEEQEEHPSPPPKSPKREQQKQSQTKEQEQPRPPRRTEEERRQNAEAWRKENPSESPSDIFLDVKSTKEGIQLTIRIPTVFGGQQIKPNIS
ncbi:hypothetical protein B0T21DRAFT_272409, partial [Apiosordaria backusii]